MKYLAIALFAITTSCSMQRPSIRDVSKLVDVACLAAQVAPNREYEGKPASYWCAIAGITLTAVDAIVEAAAE